MISIKNGMDARNHWNMVLQQQKENALPINGPQLSEDLKNTRPETKNLLSQVARDGVAVIENYWTREQCDQAISEIDSAIERYPEAVRVFSGGADKRMFGTEMVSPMALAFHDDDYLRAFGECCGNLGLYNFATLAARIDATSDNRGSGDGWHRDAFGFQFKSIIYLTDVTLENGPFEYLVGSHKTWRVVVDSALGRLPAPPQSRIEAEAVEALLSSGKVVSQKYLAKAGTVVLANTAGVHRGMPLRSGQRYALTNYYYHHYQVGQTMLDKFSPMMPGASERVAAMINS